MSVIQDSASMSKDLIRRHSAASDGWEVIHGMMRFHHPRAFGSQAPPWNTVLGERPTQFEGEAHTVYHTKYDVWVDRCALYSEFGHSVRSARFSIWFIDGLQLKFRTILATRRDELVVFEKCHRTKMSEPTLKDSLTVRHMGALLETVAPVTILSLIHI